jgi:hypothetical protein
MFMYLYIFWPINTHLKINVNQQSVLIGQQTISTWNVWIKIHKLVF